MMVLFPAPAKVSSGAKARYSLGIVTARLKPRPSQDTMALAG